MKNVLLVGEDLSFLNRLATSFRDRARDQIENWSIAITDPQQAMDHLNGRSCDLAVVELKMPSMEEWGLLKHLEQHHPTLPVIVVAVFFSNIVKSSLEKLGVKYLFRKSTDPDEIVQSAQTLWPVEGPESDMETVSIANFLQLIEMEQKTCLVQAEAAQGREKGLFYFQDGVLFDALTGSHKGEDAALAMIGWDLVRIRYKKAPARKVVRRIHRGLMSLLLEGARARDDRLAEGSSEEDEEGFSLDRAEDSAWMVTGDEPVVSFGSDGFDELDEGVSSSPLEAPSPSEEGLVSAPSPALEFDHSLVDEIMQIQGVIAASLFDPDGRTVRASGSWWRADVGSYGAFVKQLRFGAERMSRELHLQHLSTLTFEAKEAIVLCAPLGEMMLVVAFPHSRLLGLIRQKVRKICGFVDG